MITKIDIALSEALVEKGILTDSQVEPFAQEASKSKESLFTLLLKNGLITEEALLKCASEVIRTPLIDLSGMKVDPAVIEKIPLKIVEYYKMAPVKLEKRKLRVAVSSPLDLRTRDDIRAHIGYEIEFVLAREKQITEMIQRSYGFAAGTIGEMMAASPKGSPESLQATAAQDEIENIEALAGDASIAKLVNQIILEAYRKRATDIHIEPYRGKVRLRYRIDGILSDANVQNEMSRFILPILSRIKIISNLNIVEKRLPQDGRAIVKVEDMTLDLRVSSIPAAHGESVVIRMLPMNRIFDLVQLGLSEDHLEIFENLIRKPHGIIFITGPTGSGKSTTLYACLNKINAEERKIITIEDPVEYEMEGVTQIQVSPLIGLDFAKGLRSMLRHDPDVMMVGEVRDLETAEIAIRVALTGHLVFSTIHTNDAASGITRLIDIGLEPYLVASSVEAFVAQRLVRLICVHCKQEDKSPPAVEIKRQIARELRPSKEGGFKVYRGKGCSQCNSTGFWGRKAIYEILLVSEKIKSLIVQRATSNEIKRQAMAEGMRTLREDGWQKVLQGLTTADEILEITPGDKETQTEERETEINAVKRSEAAVRRGGENPRVWERRTFMRLDCVVNVRYKIVKDTLLPKEVLKKSGDFSVTRNISAGGMVFLAKEIISISSILELNLELPDGEDPIECLVRVVRQEETEDEKIYEVAVYFLDLSGAARTRLEKYVKKETG